ncbi:sulfatase-like hydrolase/transferase [Aporhodopirellula aestuarii]|uniref:Sulfatase-like hydrolase/transferase n=1 Tax=Aporhodopirellula aestuarii TaxID=2950107 RepID=A0ABT0U0F1_9BACT|nr:sulfatase-like hydrolase/transferase [Aporhodopirellula aestuarii]MCM2370332.1 sulfatase-like hydrolase/transferase [Aporhodopirellula aestuarii]
MKVPHLLSFSIILAGLGCLVTCGQSVAAEATATTPARPNILWLTSEDNGPELGCYGDTYADTPHIDNLASRSLRYRMCWSNAPVCAPARTTLISGMYATSLGGQHMRSAVALPEGMKLYPHVLREAGYYCTNHTKTDYNFRPADSKAGWHDSGKTAHWKNRPDPSMPFFSVFNYTISHESKIRNKPHTLVHDPAKAVLPVYHPDTPEVRRDWAQYYDRLTEMDKMVGAAIAELNDAGLADSTIIFYYGDHGSGMPRSKRWPFNSGLQVPLVVHIPDAYRDLAPADYLPGGVSDRLVSFVDFAPTAISLAGAEPPANMQGVPFMGKYAGQAKKHLFGYRGRMDERIDMVRSCTDGRFVYMRHFYPDRPYLKHVDYMFQTPTTRIWKELYEAGQLTDAQAKFWQIKPTEELFDLQSDPDEVDNVASLPEHEEKLAELREATQQWMRSTRDLGLLTEAEMHRRSATVAPRTLGLSDQFDVDALVDAAWAAGDAWQACDGQTIVAMQELCQSEDPGVRYWGCRGLALGLGSHGTVLSEDEISAATGTLMEKLEDANPSVRLAACDLLIRLNDEGAQRAAAEELMNLADLPRGGYYVGIAALNVIDYNRNAVLRHSGRGFDSIRKDREDEPSRGNDYIERLLITLGQPQS